MKHWRDTGNFPTDLEPCGLTDRELEDFYTKSPAPNLQYLGKDGISTKNLRIPTEQCVRVNVRTSPIDTHVGIPPEFIKYKKTTLVQRRNLHAWELIEDRCDSDLVTTFRQEDHIDRSLTFLQPRRNVTTSREKYAFVAFLSEENNDQNSQGDNPERSESESEPEEEDG